MTRSSAPRPIRHPSAESGFTLIELLVYMSFAVVVLSIVGGMLVSSLRTERDVRSAAEASDLGQVIARSVQIGIRNASQVALTTVSGTQFLIARTAGGGTTAEWACQAWYYTPDAGGSIYIKRTTPASVILPPTASSLAGWTKLGDGVSVSGAAVFSGINGRIDLELDVDAGNQMSVSVNSTAAMRTLATGSAPCF